VIEGLSTLHQTRTELALVSQYLTDRYISVHATRWHLRTVPRTTHRVRVRSLDKSLFRASLYIWNSPSDA